MSRAMDKIQEDSFRWGVKMDVDTHNRDVTMYKSFIYHGVEYSQYDCVCMFCIGSKETDIGKIMKIWERKQIKKVKILWFFRPIDIRNFITDYEPSWNELFLASGDGKGVYSVIPLESIVGKCNVICTSKDRRNTPPSKSDLGKAEYIFSHTFDVGSLTISEKFPEKISEVKVERLFNQDKPKASVECMPRTAGARARVPTNQGKSVHIVEKDSQVGTVETGISMKDSIKGEISRTSEDFKQHISEQPVKKRKIQLMGVKAESANLVRRNLEDPKSILESLPSFGAKRSPNNPPFSSSNYTVVEKETSQATNCIATNKDTRSWFLDELPWERRVKMAQDREILVCLDNLDPSFSSSKIKDMIWKVFKLESEARVIPAGLFSSPYGQALVILKSKHDADFMIQELRTKCLVIGDRPLIAGRKTLGELKPCTYPGHLTVKRIQKRKWGEEHKQAVSTSHCSQSNTIEYDMANQWRILQEKSHLWWRSLNEEQEKEVSMYKDKLKRHESPTAAGGGSSRGSSFEPVEYKLEKDKTVHISSRL